MSNFYLHILEYCDSDNVIIKEQFWIDKIKPQYNTNPTAGSSKGFKHSIESIEKMRELATGRKHTDQVKTRLSEINTGSNNPFFGKKHLPSTIDNLKLISSNREYKPVKGLQVEVTDIENKDTFVFDSVREAAKFLNSDIKTLLRRERSQLEKGVNTLYRKRYFININRV